VRIGRVRANFSAAGCFRLAVARMRNNPQRGFTIIELMIGVLLVAILLGIGMPAFRSFILEQRLRATGSDLRVALTLARSEAVKRNREVTLRRTDEAEGWSKGWMIPIPPDPDPDDPDVPALLKHVQTGDVTITGPDVVTFTPSGRAKVPPGSIQLQIDIGPDASTAARYVCLESQLDGRVHSCRQACPVPAAALPEPCDASDESRTL
jgi:type IV fimbrial biogenesis protein FimT